MSEVLNVEEIFGSKVFTLGKMRERLPKSVYKEVKKIIDHGGELSLATADVVAKAMKDWNVLLKRWRKTVILNLLLQRVSMRMARSLPLAIQT